MRPVRRSIVLAAGLVLGGCGNSPADLAACARVAWAGLRPVAEARTHRFLGKVDETRARCRGGTRAVERRHGPWVDWPGYWGTGDAASRSAAPEWGFLALQPDQRG